MQEFNSFRSRSRVKVVIPGWKVAAASPPIERATYDVWADGGRRIFLSDLGSLVNGWSLVGFGWEGLKMVVFSGDAG